MKPYLAVREFCIFLKTIINIDILKGTDLLKYRKHVTGNPWIHVERER